MQGKAWKSYPKDHAPSKVRPMSIEALPQVPMDDKLGSNREQWKANAEPGKTGFLLFFCNKKRLDKCTNLLYTVV
jgi:hypothetical protein